MLKVGLTGGIGCGKSTVSHLFSKLGVPIIDADEISHHLVQSGQPALLAIKEAFGSGIFLENGELNRVALKAMIFETPAIKQQLESILHPLVFQEILNKINLLTDVYCIVSIPLLFETHAELLVDRILVVNCDEQTQIERVKQRDNLSLEYIKSIMATQVSSAFRLKHADDIIDNSKNDTALAEHVKKLHNFYLSLSLC
ncbi:MAG: dephospho-CoA kinase [Methylococcales bacterium]|nr:dephospho-CoA kinase [Methylococcales bacterium]MDD5753362.1 dephospho-CoA kinase [Methylococcales bacterium]